METSEPSPQPIPTPPTISGILVIDKRGGITSARLVDRVKGILRRVNGQKNKVGHAGTLDPFATGILLVLCGRATRLSEALMDHPKTYIATINFGATTRTDDIDSPPEATPGAILPTREQIEAALPRFVGTIMQRPPVFSALRVGGRRAYELARKGRPPELAPRPVLIHSISLIDTTPASAQIEVTCGRGTYIRALARDLGASLGCGGYLSTLRRTSCGGFTQADAKPLEQITPDIVLSCLKWSTTISAASFAGNSKHMHIDG